MKQTNTDKLTILIIFAVGILGGLLFQFLSAQNKSNPAPTSKADTFKGSDINEFRGFALQLHYPSDDHPYEKYVDEIAATNANTISFIVTGYQENGSSSSIFVDIRKTPSDKKLLKLMNLARKKQLRVILMPIVLLKNARDGEWRGKISPPNWNDWWDDYRNFIIPYARLAAKGKAEVFVIGSELVSTEKFRDRWEKLIAEIRWVYPGRLCYSANWDHYRPIEWWDKLDIIGMTTYYDLTEGEKPTIPKLRESWNAIKKDILEWQGKINRPILFTEVGWPNQETCAQYPWDYYRNPDKPDPQAQANCFEAFFRTWIPEPSVAGYLVWEWRNHPGQLTGPKDTSYVPIDKPAMNVITKYFDMPSPPGSKSRPVSQPVSKPAVKK